MLDSTLFDNQPSEKGLKLKSRIFAHIHHIVRTHYGIRKLHSLVKW